jgi:hypothetical protein
MILKKSPDSFDVTETDTWHSHLPVASTQVASVEFGGSSALSVPMLVFTVPTAFACSSPAVQPVLVDKVPKRRRGIPSAAEMKSKMM